MNPFDYLTSITETKKNIIVDYETEKGYNPFIVNRGLSYFQDTILFANEMNVYRNIDKKLQYDFLINTIRKRKRRSKWFKAEDSAAIDAIKEYYGYSNEKARQALTLLTDEQIELLKQKVSKGGRTRK